MTRNLPAVLVIMDGFGETGAAKGNAIAAADTPNLDELFGSWPHTDLNASGLAVGLPEGQMGNSEVGHLNIGAGRVVYQELTRINLAIADGSLAENPVLADAIDGAVAAGRAVHFMGLLSDGGVHSHRDHLYALLEMAKARGADRIFVHALLRRPRCPTRERSRLRRRRRRVLVRPRRRADCDGHGPLLRHGPGQPVGSRRESVEGHRAR